MAHQLTILPQLKLNVLHFSGPLDRTDLDDMWLGLAREPGYDPAFDDLVVYAPDASFAGVDFHTAKEQAQRLVGGAAQANSSKRRALVTANAMQGVLGRMFLGFVRSFAPANFEIECFDNLPTAMAWIEAGRTAFRPLDRAVVLRALAELDRRSGNSDPNIASSGRL